MNSTDKHIIQEHPQFAINGLFIIILFYLRLPVKFFLHSSKWYLTSIQYKFYKCSAHSIQSSLFYEKLSVGKKVRRMNDSSNAGQFIYGGMIKRNSR